MTGAGVRAARITLSVVSIFATKLIWTLATGYYKARFVVKYFASDEVGKLNTIYQTSFKLQSIYCNYGKGNYKHIQMKQGVTTNTARIYVQGSASSFINETWVQIISATARTSATLYNICHLPIKLDPLITNMALFFVFGPLIGVHGKHLKRSYCDKHQILSNWSQKTILKLFGNATLRCLKYAL